MFTKREISRNLLGCLEIALFMRCGAQRFADTAQAMKKSFLIPLLSLPVTFVIVIAAHPQTLSDTEASLLMLIYGLRLAISLGLFMALVYYMARKTDAVENFYRFATAHNWLVLPAVALMLPLVLAFVNGHYAWNEVYPLMVAITLYSYAYSAFMITHIMRVPWELACCVAITGMAIHQTSLSVVKWLAVSTINLIS